MRVLIENGVDYLQGFYLGRPSYDVYTLPETLRADIRGWPKTGFDNSLDDPYNPPLCRVY